MQQCAMFKMAIITQYLEQGGSSGVRLATAGRPAAKPPAAEAAASRQAWHATKSSCDINVDQVLETNRSFIAATPPSY